MSTASRFLDILAAARGKRVAVIGDYMLDRHIQGSVRRISPEAPVPVVEIEDERSSLGGAGNVVANLASLGVRPLAFGICGNDQAKNLMRGHLDEFGCDCAGLIESEYRRTTEKIRVIAHDQHVVRVDRETAAPLDASEASELIAALEAALPSLDAVILQDYNKGVLTPEIIARSLQLSRDFQIPVFVDPKFDHFAAYKRAHLFKPNLREAERALGVKVTDEESLLDTCDRLLAVNEPDVLMLTRGEKGMTICSSSSRTSIPTHARDVADVSGAGDTVISTFVVCELGGAEIIEAATFANIAAGIVCGQVGVVPISEKEMSAALMRAE
ncbi:MAG: D-glycero-beta-D-manno-heptose-7-phosphate kinase [Calditrichaeota bacterium]|nr:D-glycero-beta-D-manno-heptose-7-phosphate kinase [Calditrichota bacterium]MCB9366392.1 D-glycero-beta-D-manno-heptose-7-phosphate kinase [Calditrichota bacterium]MCB9391978.1 D-glycero-beta-D-manno-heptose-7-phosphate kinase [Calditrichota bacterium]